MNFPLAQKNQSGV